MMSPLIQPSSQIAPPSIGPATPGPMTPMTPASADPGILPQLQLLHFYVMYKIINNK